MSKIQLNKNQKEVLFIVALFLVPFLDPGFALLLGLILSLTIGHPFLAINSRITHILLQISVVGLGFGMNVEQAIEAGKTGILFTIFSIVVTIGLGLFFTSKLRVNRDTGFLVSGGTAICGGSAIAALAPVIKAKDKDITVAMGTIFMLNAVALFIFPIIGRWLEMDDHQFGILVRYCHPRHEFRGRCSQNIQQRGFGYRHHDQTDSGTLDHPDLTDCRLLL